MRATKAADRNRTEAASALLADVDEWCAATKTNQSRVGSILFRHPGFVALLRKRLQVTQEKEGQVRDLIAANPDGVTDIPDQDPHVHPKLAPRLSQKLLLEAVRSAACQKCGGSCACSYPTCPLREAA
jgi:hypothetical protein